MTDIEKLQQIIDNSNNIVFFGGAGVSTESGIPDFRSVDGLYNMKYKFPPEEIISHDFFFSKTEDFYDFNGGIQQSDQEINDWIREAIDYFLAHPDESLKFVACGNSILFALNADDGIHFYVAKGYYVADIE